MPGNVLILTLMQIPANRSVRCTMPTLHAGTGRGSHPAQIRDRKASDSTRIPRKMAFNGAQTCVSNQMNKRKNPHDYAE